MSFAIVCVSCTPDNVARVVLVVVCVVALKAVRGAEPAACGRAQAVEVDDRRAVRKVVADILDVFPRLWITISD